MTGWLLAGRQDTFFRCHEMRGICTIGAGDSLPMRQVVTHQGSMVGIHTKTRDNPDALRIGEIGLGEERGVWVTWRKEKGAI